MLSLGYIVIVFEILFLVQYDKFSNPDPLYCLYKSYNFSDRCLSVYVNSQISNNDLFLSMFINIAKVVLKVLTNLLDFLENKEEYCVNTVNEVNK